MTTTAPDPGAARPVLLPAASREDDETWQERVAKALEARETGAWLRQGKPKSFRQAVGKA